MSRGIQGRHARGQPAREPSSTHIKGTPGIRGPDRPPSLDDPCYSVGSYTKSYINEKKTSKEARQPDPAAHKSRRTRGSLSGRQQHGSHLQWAGRWRPLRAPDSGRPFDVCAGGLSDRLAPGMTAQYAANHVAEAQPLLQALWAGVPESGHWPKSGISGQPGPSMAPSLTHQQATRRGPTGLEAQPDRIIV